MEAEKKITEEMDPLSGISYGLIKGIFKDLKSGKKGFKKFQIESRWKSLIKYDEASTDTKFHDFLRTIYEDDVSLLSIGKHNYACTFYSAPDKQLPNPDSILNKLSYVDLPENLIKNQKFRSTIMDYQRLKGKLYHNGKMYSMKKARLNGELKLDIYESDYFSVIESCDYLKYEAQKAWITQYKKLLKNPLKVLKQRGYLHDNVSNPLLDGNFRSAGIAVSTLLCYKDGNDYKLILKKRSQGKAALSRGGIHHVMPAGMFSPSEVNDEGPYSIYENVLREYAEELFNEIEDETCIDFKWYRQRDCVKRLLSYFDKGDDSGIYFVGLAVNLLTLRPEVITLLFINSEEWVKNDLPKTQINWEYEKGSMFIELSNLDSLKKSDKFCPTGMVPPGAAALWKGGELAKKISK